MLYMFHTKRISSLVFLLMLCWRANSQPVISVQSATDLLDVGKEVWLLEDKTGRLSLAEILQPAYQHQFSRSTMQVPNLSSTRSAAWIKLQVEVPRGKKYYLEVGYPLLYELDFYTGNENQPFSVIKSGTSRPFGERALESPNFYFELSPQHNTYYLRATSYEILQFPLKVGTLEAFFGQSQLVALLNGLYLGFVVLIVLYNFFLYLSTRERVYLSYVLYVIAVGLVTSNLLGYNFQFLYPTIPALNFYTPIFYPLNFFVLIFSMDFLSIKQNSPRYSVGFKWLIGICLGEILLNLAGFPHLMFQISQGVGLLVVGYILLVAGTLYRKGYGPAKFFLLAFVTFLAGIVITILLSTGVIPYSVWAYHSLQIGSAIEIVLLSFAIADKINIYKSERETAQLFALQQAAENQRIIANQKLELEVKARERTKKIEKQKEEILSQNDLLNQAQEELQAQSEELERKNRVLTEYRDLLNSINQDLQIANINLEGQVAERTLLLTHANEALVKQNIQLEEYAFVTSHNLRAPVARLLGLGSVFDKSPAADQSYNLMVLDKMQHETQALDAIIKDLNLALSVARGVLPPTELVDVRLLINVVLQKLEQEIAAVQAVVNLNFGAIGHITSVGANIQHIFYLLISNALKFREPTRQLIIEISALPVTETEIRISVKDNGRGIDLKYASGKLFKLYQRFHTDPAGKGVGLYLVKTQVEQLGGKIEVNSEEHIGTTFHIYLPVTLQHQAQGSGQ